MSELLAYLAGLVDGEAYIGIKKSLPKKQNGERSPTYHERIQIRMVNEIAIKIFSDTFGGSYYREAPHADKGKPLYCYQVSDRNACRILRELLPYLQVKKRDAELVLELRKLKEQPHSYGRGKGSMSEVDLHNREILYKQLKVLHS